jgi:hypothetical protein
MGADNQHVKYIFADQDGRKFSAVAFGAADKFVIVPNNEEGEPNRATILVELMKNEWNGVTKVEGRLLNVQRLT